MLAFSLFEIGAHRMAATLNGVGVEQIEVHVFASTEKALPKSSSTWATPTIQSRLWHDPKTEFAPHRCAKFVLKVITNHRTGQNQSTE